MSINTRPKRSSEACRGTWGFCAQKPALGPVKRPEDPAGIVGRRPKGGELLNCHKLKTTVGSQDVR
jgi:hypothetical protein